MTDEELIRRGDALARMNAARDANTCQASRHAAMIAEALVMGEPYPMLSEEPKYCGATIAAVVASLWEARTAIADLADAARAAQIVTDRIEALTEQLEAACADAKEAEAYAEELEKERDDYAFRLADANNTYSEMHVALSEANDKLAKAEWLLTDAAVQLEEGKIKTRRNRAALIWQFLKEIKAP